MVYYRDRLSGGLSNGPLRFAFALRYATGSATKLKPENSRSRSVGVASRQALRYHIISYTISIEAM